MTTWRYIKGSEKDFIGAPEWANMKCYCSLDGEPNDDVAWCEGVFKGALWKFLESYSQRQKMGYPKQWHAIAQRERVTSINDDRLAQEMRPRSIVKPDGTIEFGCMQAPLVTDNVNPKYNRPCKGMTIDVYDVLQAFNVTNPALQHLVKKALAVGQRGHKDKMEDLRDILASAQRAIELEEMKQ